MPSDIAGRALRDMAYHIDLAASFTTALGLETFRDGLRTVYAVTAVLKLSPKPRAACPTI
jgi:hypothetical protein